MIQFHDAYIHEQSAKYIYPRHKQLDIYIRPSPIFATCTDHADVVAKYSCQTYGAEIYFTLNDYQLKLLQNQDMLISFNNPFYIILN